MSRCDRLAAGRERRAEDEAARHGKAPHFAAAAHVPETQGLIAPARDDMLAIIGQGDAGNLGAMTIPALNLAAAVQIP